MRPRAADHNRLTQAAAALANPTGGSQATSPGIGTQQVPVAPPFLWARILGWYLDTGGTDATGCQAFAWEEADDFHCELTWKEGTSMRSDQPPASTRPRWPAYEVNGCDVEPGKIVQLWRGNGNYFLFLRPVDCESGSGSGR